MLVFQHPWYLFYCFWKIVIVRSFKISKDVFDNCCKWPPSIVMRVVKVSGKYLSCIQTSYLRTIKNSSSTFQCSAQGTFHTNMQSSHFFLFKAFANCFHTLIWKGGSNTSFGLIKGKCIIFLLPISNLSFFGQLSLVQCSWQALLSHRHKKHRKFVYPLCCLTNMHKFF